jgi:phosphoglycerate dehydrogenase-like enzyme
MMKGNRIVYLEPIPDDVRAIIASRLPEGFQLAFRDESTPVEQAVSEADFILVATTKLTRDVLSHTQSLRLIQHQGVGYDNIDLVAAGERQIPVAICPAGTSVGVAEHVVLLILSIYRRLLEADASMRRGDWLQWELRPASFELAGKTVGLIGLGRIGREVAKRLRGFSTTVLYHDAVRASAEVEEMLDVEFVSIDALLGRSDIVSVHVPLSPETRHLIDADALGRMKSTAILINTARGGLVDEPALIDALRSGAIAAAGLDVFATEPLSEASPLRTLANVVLTPHIAAGTADALKTKMEACFANVVAVSKGQEPKDRVA